MHFQLHRILRHTGCSLWLGLSLALARQSIGELNSSRRDIHFSALYTRLEDIIRYVSWSDETTDTICVGLIGSEKKTEKLLEAQKADNSSTVQLISISDTTDITQCQVVVFLGDTPNGQRILQRLRKKPVLTIGVDDDFAESGGIIEITKVTNGAMRFECNLRMLQESGLEIHPHFIQMADSVHETVQ
ncbi:MAG: YfiR family protein [Chitinivibrionales bacterium]